MTRSTNRSSSLTAFKKIPAGVPLQLSLLNCRAVPNVEVQKRSMYIVNDGGSGCGKTVDLMDATPNAR
jgi:hypothetical protein